jgi:hypothetical protein
MDNDIEFRAKVAAFVRRNGLSDTRFGLLVSKDAHLYGRVMRGATRRPTNLRIARFMQLYELQHESAA